MDTQPVVEEVVKVLWTVKIWKTRSTLAANASNVQEPSICTWRQSACNVQTDASDFRGTVQCACAWRTTISNAAPVRIMLRDAPCRRSSINLRRAARFGLLQGLRLKSFRKSPTPSPQTRLRRRLKLQEARILEDTDVAHVSY